MRHIAVIGLSDFGYHAALQLMKNGCEVTVIDYNRTKIESIKDEVSHAIVADASNKEVLEGLELNKMDVVVLTIGSDLSKSILTTLYLKELGCKEIVVRVQNEAHGKVVSLIGAKQVLFPERDMGINVANSLSFPGVLDSLELATGYSVIELGAPKAFIGKSIKELDVRAKYNVQIIAIKEVVPERFNLIPPASFVIKDSDILILLGRDEDLDKLKKL
ncbi:MAG: TrkA family potassium uptake protein [Candidatus Schekmanbacteria bacterium]|nr:MAG: TrkA family potassium uptake protein [Candidatus Schekmanbacteria bacterium]